MVADTTSRLPGQTTFLNSIFTSSKKPITFFIIIIWQAREDSNPQHAVLETAALPIGATGLFYLSMQSMFFTKWTIFIKFQLIFIFLLILGCCVVLPFTFCTCKLYYFTHNTIPYSIISVTTPAPTVLPPSLIANLVSFSKAIGAISLTVISTLSPGITISVPSGRFTVPVTSVVLT